MVYIFGLAAIDNSFSIHTSKRLTFFVALEERHKAGAQSVPEMSGWLLKKKRKRMQGKFLHIAMMDLHIIAAILAYKLMTVLPIGNGK
jgi:hypothetical protein